MTKAELTRRAIVKMEEAIAKLAVAKDCLRAARNEQYVRLATKLAEIEEIYGILTDPECTPELEYVPDPEFDPCVWDSDRIDAEKTLLFHEHVIGGGRMR